MLLPDGGDFRVDDLLGAGLSDRKPDRFMGRGLPLRRVEVRPDRFAGLRVEKSTVFRRRPRRKLTKEAAQQQCRVRRRVHFDGQGNPERACAVNGFDCRKAFRKPARSRKQVNNREAGEPSLHYGFDPGSVTERPSTPERVSDRRRRQGNPFSHDGRDRGAEHAPRVAPSQGAARAGLSLSPARQGPPRSPRPGVPAIPGCRVRARLLLAPSRPMPSHQHADRERCLLAREV